LFDLNVSQCFPNNRSRLYKKALRILLEEWAAEKRTSRDDIYEGLSIEQEEILLSEIAYNGMVADQHFFAKRTLSTKIKDFLSSNLNAPKHLDGEAVLNAIRVQRGILVERVEDTYSFSHLTLQEYLSAQYLVDNKKWKPLLKKHLTDSRWQETFLLLPGLIRGKTGVDDLLIYMEGIANRYLNSPKLKKLVQWANLSTRNSSGRSNPATKRVVAVVLTRARALDIDLPLPLAFAQALAFALNLDSALLLTRRTFPLAHPLNHPGLTIDRALALFPAFMQAGIFGSVDFDALGQSFNELKNNLPGAKASLIEKKQFIKKLYDLWFSALGIEAEATVISKAESQSLANYFYACELMIRCKEGAVRVSPDVWAGIESRILTVPEASEAL